MSQTSNSQLKQILMLQGAIFLYSFCGVFQKNAARYPVLSKEFILYYACSIGIMVIYAFLWQLILRGVSLTTAYSNRAVSMIWSLIWGASLFHETIRWNQILGAAIICFGVYEGMKAEHE